MLERLSSGGRKLLFCRETWVFNNFMELKLERIWKEVIVVWQYYTKSETELFTNLKCSKLLDQVAYKRESEVEWSSACLNFSPFCGVLFFRDGRIVLFVHRKF